MTPSDDVLSVSMTVQVVGDARGGLIHIPMSCRTLLRTQTLYKWCIIGVRHYPSMIKTLSFGTPSTASFAALFEAVFLLLRP
jgi:hypothetical protein